MDTVLEQLGVPRHGVLYVQSSVDWIQRAGFTPSDVLTTLTTWVSGGGTLVMPTYPFLTTHQEYIENGAVYDVARTPAAIGLLPEIFRRSPGVVRSLDPDFCVAALGDEAEAIVGREPAAPDPFGLDSSYQRMLDRHATLVGLGVSLNTSSFIHVLDSRAEAGYPTPVYQTRLWSTTVVEPGGRSRQVWRRVLRPAFQKLTSPSAIGTLMRPSASAFATVEINGARFFKWALEPWFAWCQSHAAQRAAVREWPCWLSRMSGESG